MRADRQLLFWGAVGIFAFAAVFVLRPVLLPFVAGMVIAYALNPVAEFLVRRGLSRTIASAIVVALIMTALVLAIVFLLPVVIAQLQQLIEFMPTASVRLRQLVEEVARERLGDRFEAFRQGLDRAVTGVELDWSLIVPAVLKSLWAQGLAVVNLVSLALVTPLVVFYLLVDWQPMLRRIESWIPRATAPTVDRLAGDIDAAIAAFIRGQGLVCLILAAFYAIGLTWVGLRYGLLIGLATGLLCFIPYVGWALGVIVSCVMVLLQAWPDLVPLYKVVAIFLAGMAIDSAFLSPRIVGSRIGLHPLWLIFSIFAFSYLLGFVGVLLAVPLAAACAVLVRHGLEVYLGSDVYHGRSTSAAAKGHQAQS